jgi:heme-degrading monooxygenase HmoA
MYSRVTLLEIDTLRTSLLDVEHRFEVTVIPRLEEMDGYEGALVLATPEGKGMVVTLWATEQSAQASAAFARSAADEFVTLYRAPAGREHYDVMYLNVPAAAAA